MPWNVEVTVPDASNFISQSSVMSGAFKTTRLTSFGFVWKTVVRTTPSSSAPLGFVGSKAKNERIFSEKTL